VGLPFSLSDAISIEIFNTFSNCQEQKQVFTLCLVMQVTGSLNKGPQRRESQYSVCHWLWGGGDYSKDHTRLFDHFIQYE
jgi:hypothetical protein